MAQIPRITVEVILKFDKLEQFFQEWLSEQPQDERIEDALNVFLDWLKKRISKATENKELHGNTCDIDR